jgi:hypothetical protein
LCLSLFYVHFDMCRQTTTQALLLLQNWLVESSLREDSVEMTIAERIQHHFHTVLVAADFLYFDIVDADRKTIHVFPLQ